MELAEASDPLFNGPFQLLIKSRIARLFPRVTLIVFAYGAEQNGADTMSFAKPALLGPEKVSVGSNARELWGRNEPYSGMPPVRSIWSAPRGSPGMQNSVVPDAQRTLAGCGPSASSVRSGGILAGASTCLNKNHRSRQPDIQELPLRTTPRVPSRFHLDEGPR
jgi:hypothetical protein